MDALRESFPSGLSAHEVEQKTGLPLKTVYASLKELNRELFVDQLGKRRKVRGRPLLREVQPSASGERHRSQFVIEDRSRTYEMHDEDNYAMAPANVDYPRERHEKFIEFMRNNEFLDVDSYQTMISNIEKFQTKEFGNNNISLKQMCDHFCDITNQNISPKTPGCEECEKEGIESVGLRLCLTCGHVGCSGNSNLL